MIQGAERKMIVVKTSTSSVFEEAYFVVRRDAVRRKTDMITEANRIIDGYGENKSRDLLHRLALIGISTGCFVSGGVIGAAIAVLLCGFA